MEISHPRTVVARISIAAALGVALLVMSSIFIPDPIQADGADYLVPPNGPTTNPHTGLRSLGTIEDLDYRVEIFEGRGQPLYSVYDNEGELIATLLTEAQVGVWFPEIPLPSMDYGTPQNDLLMLAVPETIPTF